MRTILVDLEFSHNFPIKTFCDDKSAIFSALDLI